jgi:hypothetical protein
MYTPLIKYGSAASPCTVVVEMDNRGSDLYTVAISLVPTPQITKYYVVKLSLKDKDLQKLQLADGLPLL